MSFRTPKKYLRKIDVEFTLPSLTEQCHMDECKVQNILKKYRETGRLEHTAKYEGTYMDFANAPDYTEAQIIIANAKSMFETVPASIRSQFDNNPMKYVEFMQDENKRDEIEAMGLSTSHLPPRDTNPTIPTPTPTKSPEAPSGSPEPTEAPST